MQKTKWPGREIWFRESKKIRLYGMEKYCVSEGYDSFEWNQWKTMMAFWEFVLTCISVKHIHEVVDTVRE